MKNLAPLRYHIMTMSIACLLITALIIPGWIGLDGSTSQHVQAQQNDRILLSGTWQRTDEAQAHSGVVAMSTTPGDTMTLHITGDSFTLYRRMGPDGGRMEVVIDGEYHGTLEFHFFEERWSVPAYFDNLGEGTHTLTFTVSTRSHEDSTGTRVGIEVVEEPGQLLPTPAQTAAVEHVNSYRERIGLPPVQDAAALRAAAQNHAEFFVTEWRDDCIPDYPASHYECPETAPGYTGYSPSDRARYAGYTTYAGENLTFMDDPYASVDIWMAMPYHRMPLMFYNLDELGYGAAAGIRLGGVMKIHRNLLQAPNERVLYTYPVDNQGGVPIAWNGGEKPDPLPGKTFPVGSLISFYIAQPLTDADVPTDTWHVETASLKNEQGTDIAIYVLHKNNDPNTSAPGIIHIFPQLPLASATTYTAHVAGTDSRGVAFDHSWSFTTATALEVTSILPAVGATGGEIRWALPTSDVITGWVEYGPTESYGQQAAQYTSWEGGGQFYYAATLLDLQPGTTYHYRIVTEDEEGNRASTDDRRFTTKRDVRTIRVPEDSPDLTTATQAALPGDTITIAAGTYILSEHLWFRPGVHLRGAGQGQTMLHADHDGTLMTLNAGSHLSDLTLMGNGQNTGIWVPAGAAPVIRNVHITGFDRGAMGYGNPTIVQSLLTDNRYNIAIWVGQARIINNTIIGGEYGIVLGTPGNTILNTIIAQQSKYGLLFPDDSGLTSGHNSFWGNAQDAQWGYTCVITPTPICNLDPDLWELTDAPGTDNITADPRFTDPAAGDYTLQPDSPLRDAGHPDAPYIDADGNATDIGATGAPQLVADLVPEIPEPPELPTPEPAEILLPPAEVEQLPTVFLPLVTR